MGSPCRSLVSFLSNKEVLNQNGIGSGDSNNTKGMEFMNDKRGSMESNLTG